MYTREKPMRRPRRMTHNQSLVLEVLRTEGRAMTAYQILDALREHGLRAPVQVYRALESLLERGSEEHTSELQSLMRISYAVFCLKKKNIDQMNQLDRVANNT